MNQRIAIITDSCADIPANIREQKHIRTLPVLVSIDGTEYHDGIDIDNEQLFAAMESGSVPKTSLPPETELIDILDTLKSEGITHTLIVTMSSAISGTYQMINRVCNEYKAMTCKAVDSGMAAIAEGALAIELADEAASGLSWEALLARIQKLKENTLPFFGLDTLKYLMRGGRIGKVTAIAGEVLNIKPILSFDENGVIDSVEKVRGRKAVINHIAERIISLRQDHKHYRLYFADNMAQDDRTLLESKVLAGCTEARDIIRSSIGCALGVHLGPGLIGAAIQLLDD